MKFRNITIPAEGRNKYGNYISSTELQKSVVRVTYNGNNTTGGNQSKQPDIEPEDVYTLFLSRSTIKFDSKKLIDGNITETIDILGFVNSRSGDTFIGNIDKMPEQDDVLFNNTYYDIIGLAEKGMTIGISDNGTPSTKINITCTKEAIENEVRGGTLIIPCSVYKKSGDVFLGPYLDDWASEKDNCYTLYLEVQWEISVLPASNVYTLELTNEIAGINCDYDGSIYANAVRPTCKAILYYGTEEVEGETYTISTDADRNAQGVSINTSTGELTFGSNFSFDGSALEVKISANYEGAVVTKIMTITKQYAGKDGKGAVTRWVVPSADTVKFNPNTNTMTPNKVSCKVMKQEGENAPVEDTTTTIYYGYNTTNPTSVYSTEITVDASKDYLVFALKNDKSEVYEIETVQIIKEGKNGTDGGNGSNGESVYRLALTNENASINADANGLIYADAHRPTCTATLFYGTTKVSNATYSITTNPTATGVTINSTTGVLTFASNFNFTGTSLEITVTAMAGGVVYGTAIMTVSKSLAGKDGVDGSDGTDGADGADGLSVYITYHDNAITSKPNKPTGNGTTNGWHTNATSTANWMSQKVAASASEGTWGDPIQICGADGADGADGSDGQDGADAVSYWLDLSTTEVVVTKGSSITTPQSVTIKAYKQIGGNAPTEITTATGTQIKWGYNTASPSNTTTTISSVNTAYTYVMVHLLVNNVTYDRQTISILKDGKDGADGADGTDGKDGAQGRQGAAIRGPIDWKNVTTSRRWCNGTLTNASYPEDAEFIDIVVFDGTYYKCTTSYNGKGGTTAPSSTYWTATDKQYEFVSTNLLLADNAKIKFATNNELYLTDNNGNVTAGAAGGNGTSFWAGANEPTNATFKVDYDGTMTATKGKFGVLEIGTDAWSDGLLTGTHTQNDGSINTLELQPQMFSMEATKDGNLKSMVRIGPYADPDHYDMEGEIFVELEDEKDIAIATNAFINAEGYRSGSYFAAFAPINGLTFTFMTDTNYFTKSGDYWYWKGMQMTPNYRVSSYPYVKLIGDEWCFCYTSTSTTGIGTGIYGTSHTKSNNQIYIVI